MRRCWETAGRLIWKCPAIVLTELSASKRRSSIRRRAGWLIAPKTSGSRSGVTTMLQPSCGTPGLPARQLGNLDVVAAGVVQLGDGRTGHLDRRHDELGAAGFDALVWLRRKLFLNHELT